MPHARHLFGCCFLLSGLLLAACATSRAPRAPDVENSSDYHLVLGELALLRGKLDVAVDEYANAMRLRDDPEVARRATQIAMHAGDTDAARAAAEQWERLAVYDPELAQYQALLHARAGETDAALRYLLRATDDDTAEAVRANLQMVTSLLAGEENVWRSADLMARLAKARPDYAEGWHGAALMAIEADRPADALRFAGEALKRNPALLDAMFLRARAQLMLAPGQAEAALAPLAALKNADDPGLRYRYAGLLAMAGKPAEADALFEDILVRNPDQQDARLARALVAMDSGRLDVAEAELHTLLQQQAATAEAMYYLGALAEQRGNPQAAIDWYGRVTPDSPTWFDAQSAAARLLRETRGAAEVQAFFDALRAEWPQQSDLLSLQEAALLTGAGDAVLALELLQPLQLQDPGLESERLWQLALAAAESGDAGLAEETFRDMLERDPSHPLVQNALGYLLLEQGRLDEAAALLEPALVAAPANPAILDSVGWLYFLQGQPAEARLLLEQAWWREPSPATGAHLLAVVDALNDEAAAARLRDTLRLQFPGAIQDRGSK